MIDNTPQRVATRWRVLWTYVVGSAAAAPTRSSPPAPTGTIPTPVAPILAELARITPRDQFMEGLDLLLDGLHATRS